jgi:adenylate cyclase
LAKEIERKFLVKGNWHRDDEYPYKIKQGYLNTDPDRTVRIRIEYDPKQIWAWLTVKGRNQGAVRNEYEVVLGDHITAEEMIDTTCLHVIHKTRTVQYHHGLKWEIDEFHGNNQGLIVAEIELESEDQELILPDWIGEEVTTDPRYYNSSLAIVPYTMWKYDETV